MTILNNSNFGAKKRGKRGKRRHSTGPRKKIGFIFFMEVFITKNTPMKKLTIRLDDYHYTMLLRIKANRNHATFNKTIMELISINLDRCNNQDGLATQTQLDHKSFENFFEDLLLK